MMPIDRQAPAIAYAFHRDDLTAAGLSRSLRTGHTLRRQAPTSSQRTCARALIVAKDPLGSLDTAGAQNDLGILYKGHPTLRRG